MADPPSQSMEGGEIQYVFRIVWCSCIAIATLTFIKYIHLLPEKLRMLYDNSWKIKHHVQHILSKLFPKYYEQGITMDTTDTVVPKVNCQSLIVIENLPKCTTAKDLVKCLNLKDMVQVKKVMKLSVAADKKGNCAGLAVALVPRYCLHHSAILSKHNSTYNGHVIKVREVRNRKINLRKQVKWLSSDNWSHVGFKGRFQVYTDILQDVTTQYGYYLIDGGSYIQYSKDDVDSIIQDSAAAGINKIVMKVRNPINLVDAEIGWCKTYPGYLYATVGAFPTVADTWDVKNSRSLIKLLEKDATNKYVAAIGECGILTPNGNLKLPSFDKQKDLFKEQVQLANRFHKPLLVISNGKVDNMLEILEQYPDVTACLTIGSYVPSDGDINKWMKKGYYLGVTGCVWSNQKDNFWLPSVIKSVPLDKIILCSNTPLLFSSSATKYDNFISEIKCSEDFKNVSKECIDVSKECDTTEEDKYNVEPLALCVVLELLASCLNKSPIKLAKIVNGNAERFYNFDSLDEK